MRGNRSLKMDSSMFNGFGSTIPPLVEGDINLTVNTEIINQIKKTSPVPIFQLELSNKFCVINLLPDTSQKYIEQMLSDKTNRAIIINGLHGFSDKLVGDRKLSYILTNKLRNEVHVIILLSRDDSGDITLERLKDHGAILLSEITRTSTIMKTSFLLANVS